MDLPEKGFKLRPGHAVILLDLAVLAGLFLLGGHLYMKYRGEGVIADKRQHQAEEVLVGVRGIEQADSVYAATEARRQQALADSASAIENLSNLHAEYMRRVNQTQSLAQGIYRLSDVVLSMRQNAEAAVRQADRDEVNVRAREYEVDSLLTSENDYYQTLLETRQEREQVRQALISAENAEEYDPTGRFPRQTGLMVRRDVGDEVDLTNVLLQQVIWKTGATDVGMSVGFGLGDEESASNKEVGLLLSRSLIHRRLALDVGAGLSELTRTEGDGDRGGYASAGLRISPFYGERMHLGLGARANHDEVVPFLGFSLGRR